MTMIERSWTDIAGNAPFVILGFDRRFDPSFRGVRARVAAGEIGPIRALRVISRDPQPPPAAYLGVSGACSAT